MSSFVTSYFHVKCLKFRVNVKGFFVLFVKTDKPKYF